MTQTNQNKDYSWQWLDSILDDLYLDAWAKGREAERNQTGIRTVSPNFREAKAATQQHIDEHYIGKGEALSACPACGYHLNVAKTACARCDWVPDVPKLYTEQEVEQRCIEAQIKVIKAEHGALYNLLPTGNVDAWELLKSIQTHMEHLESVIGQLSTNNKDTLERSSDERRD